MKTKKIGVIAVLSAVLLLSALLVTNCMEPISPGSIESSKAASGKTIIKVNNGGYQRTIMPDFTDIDDFSSFAVNIYEANATPFTGTLFDSDTAADSTTLNALTFELDTGDFYDIEVIAYSTATVVAARGTVPNYEAAGDDTLYISLLPITTGTATTGTFVYTFLAPPTVSPFIANLTVTKVGAGTAAITRNITTTLSNTTTPDGLEPGSYDVKVTVSAANHKTMAYNSSLIIVEGQPSILPDGQLPDPLLNVYTLNFDFYETAAAPTGSTKGAITGIPHGLKAIDGTGVTGSLENETIWPDESNNTATPIVHYDGYQFAGWFTGVDGTGTEFDEDTLIVLNNITLYAKWASSLTELGFDVDYIPIAAGDPVITSSGGLNYYHSNGDGTLTFSLTNLISFDGGSVTWQLNDASPVTQNTFTITFDRSTGAINNLIAGKHTLTARGNVGGFTRSATVEITVAATAP